MLLLGDWCSLAERGEGDLAAAILDLVAPGLLWLEAGRLERGVERLEDFLLLIVAEQLRINGVPVGILVHVELGAGGRHQPQLRQVRAYRQAARNLLLELRPVTARDHGDVGDGQQVSQRLAHRVF